MDCSAPPTLLSGLSSSKLLVSKTEGDIERVSFRNNRRDQGKFTRTAVLHSKKCIPEFEDALEAVHWKQGGPHK